MALVFIARELKNLLLDDLPHSVLGCFNLTKISTKSEVLIFQPRPQKTACHTGACYSTPYSLFPCDVGVCECLSLRPSQVGLLGISLPLAFISCPKFARMSLDLLNPGRFLTLAGGAYTEKIESWKGGKIGFAEGELEENLTVQSHFDIEEAGNLPKAGSGVRITSDDHPS